MLPLHPKLVHLPIALAVLMPFLFLGLGLALRRAWLPPRAWFLGLALQAVLLTGGFAARWSGEREEDRVEAQVPKGALEAHERAAQAFLIGAGGVLALAVAAAALRRPGPAQGLRIATALGAFAVLALGYRVGEAGGQLVYGPSGLAAHPAPGAPGNEGRTREVRADREDREEGEHGTREHR